MRHLGHAGPGTVTPEAFAYELSRRDLLLLALVLAVPIPIFAISGAAIPLPEIVQRVAASLVPGGADASQAAEPFAPLRRGSIQLAAEEARLSTTTTTRQPTQAVPAAPRLGPGGGASGRARPLAKAGSQARAVRAARTRTPAPPGGSRVTSPASPAGSTAAVAERPSSGSAAIETKGAPAAGADPKRPSPTGTSTVPGDAAKPLVSTDLGSVRADETGISATVVVPIGATPETSPSVGVQTSGPGQGSPTGQSTVSVDAPLPVVGTVQAEVSLPVGVGGAAPPPPAPAPSPPPPAPSSGLLDLLPLGR